MKVFQTAVLQDAFTLEGVRYMNGPTGARRIAKETLARRVARALEQVILEKDAFDETEEGDREHLRIRMTIHFTTGTTDVG